MAEQFKYLIVGGGVAGANAAVGVREIDTEGSVLIVGDESWWPYDKPPLSKNMLLGKVSPEDAESKDPSWYDKNNVQVRRSSRVSTIDRSNGTVTIEGSDSIGYEKLLIATGATPNKLGIPGAELAGVHELRRIEDSLSIRDSLKDAKSAVIIGSGYIGMEVAASCMACGVSVTIVDPADRPWSRQASAQTGNFLRRYFEAKGASFRMGAEIAELFGTEKAEGVVLKGGEKIAADLVVVGIGVTQNISLAKEAGLEVDSKDGVFVDERLRTSDANIYAAGDIAFFQDLAVGTRWHAEHFLNARWQGKQVGRIMAGANEVYDKVPYFFSDMLDLHIALRGHPRGGTSTGFIGDLDLGEFVELYARQDGSLAMGLAVSHSEPLLDKIADKLEELVRAGTQVSKIDESTFGFGEDEGLG